MITYVERVLGRRGYNQWLFRRVRKSMAKRKQEGLAKKKKEDSDRVTKTTVTIPYFKGVSEALSQVFHCHGVATP